MFHSDDMGHRGTVTLQTVGIQENAGAGGDLKHKALLE